LLASPLRNTNTWQLPVTHPDLRNHT